MNPFENLLQKSADWRTEFDYLKRVLEDLVNKSRINYWWFWANQEFVQARMELRIAESLLVELQKFFVEKLEKSGEAPFAYSDEEFPPFANVDEMGKYTHWAKNRIGELYDKINVTPLEAYTADKYPVNTQAQLLHTLRRVQYLLQQGMEDVRAA